MRRLVIVSCSDCLGVGLDRCLGSGRFKKISEFLTGYEEVPSVSTTASGNFNARISKDGSQIDWELSYSDLEGAIQQAHIHIGNKGVNGGIIGVPLHEPWQWSGGNSTLSRPASDDIRNDTGSGCQSKHPGHSGCAHAGTQHRRD